MSANSLVFVTRSGCHMCEEAEPVARRVAARAGVSLEVVSVDSDDELTRLYALRIPVILSSRGDVLAEGRVEERQLRRALRRARRRVARLGRS